MLVWRGMGFLVLVIAALGYVAGGSVGDLVGQEEARAIGSGLGLIISGVVTWLLGQRWNGEPERTLVDVETGEPVIFRRRHSLFFIPMQWWGLVVGVMGLASLFS